MGRNNFTAEQTAALNAEGRAIVSASAGSGKTTVMIEKIVRLILNGADVSEILAVTFTKKAAQQMKDKLKSALVKAINAEDTKSEDLPRLKKQLAAAQNAEFSTIHAFCAKLIRTHFYAAGTSGDFSIVAADDTVGRELQQRALSALFENAYDSGDPDFCALLSVYFRKKKDDALKDTLRSAYAALRDKDGYHEFLERATVYDKERFEGVCAEYLRLFRKKSAYYRRCAEEEKKYFERANAGENLRKSIDNANAVIGAFNDVENTTDLFALKEISPETYRAKQTKSKSLPADFDFHADALNDCKKAFGKIYEKIEALPEKSQAFSDYLEAGENAKRLKKYILAFEKEYEEEKKERNVLDYNDLEHIALSLLADEAVRGELREKYPYVFVDEYQDVNPVQEKLISAVSGNNVFLVGDVKQAIYGFRGSKSEYFAEKREEFAALEDAFSLSMNSNFRSAPAILEAVNEIFSETMNRETSFVDYKTDGMMESGGNRYAKDGRVCFHLVQGETKKTFPATNVYSVLEESRVYGDEKFKALLGRNETGEKIARIVEEEVKNVWFDPDDGTEKQIRYGDIAVLIRKNAQAESQGIAEAFTLADIPFASSSPLCLDDYPEIKTATDVLSYIDNAAQDVPLCSAMLSPAGKFSCDELSTIRLACRDEEFFRDACKKYAEEKRDPLAAKLRAFFDYFDTLRDLSAVTGAAEVLTQLFSDTGLEAGLLARRTGKESLKRLHYFLTLAVDPEPLSVHEFLVKLRLMKGKILYYETAGEDVVHILTMHSSKGLEYPVVILGDCCDSFRGKDVRGEMIADDVYGVATKFYDADHMIRRETLQRDLIDERKKIAERADELNIFYVALTRAKFALHLVFGKQPPKTNPLYASCYAEFIPPHVFEKYLVREGECVPGDAEGNGAAAGVYGSADGCLFADTLVSSDKITEKTVSCEEAECSRYGETLTSGILAELNRKYAFSGGENLPVKQSATSVIGEIERAFGAPLPAGNDYSDEEDFLREPTGTFGEFAEDGGAGGEAHRLTGLAYHAFLQYADFAFLHAGGGATADLAAAERERMKKAGLLSEEYDTLLSSEKLAKILNHSVFKEFASAEKGAKILREADFLAALPVKDVYYFDRERYGNVGEETTLFQGAIDLLFIGKDYAHIVDYKYSSRGEKSLKEKYAPQLTLYKKSVAKITGIDEKNIRCTLLNLLHGYAIDIES